jgi:capsular exopolysaccharide synthesis family protein
MVLRRKMTDHQLDHLITVANPRSPVSEAYCTLRTNLDFSSLDKPIKTMLVTSAGPGEGKSTVLANLAVTTAQTGRKVILVDCDLRRPTLHSIFNLKNDVGLTTMVVDDAAIESPPLRDTGVEGLQIVSSGPLPPNPSELLGSRRMEEIIVALSERADVVLFDAPPVVAVTDAAVLATKVDGVLLVINAGGTKRDYAKTAKARLEKVNANLLGAVLNNVQFDVSLHRYYVA